MPFLGTIVNFFTVFACGLLGMLVKKGIPENVRKTLMTAISVCVIYIGIDGALEAAPRVSDEALLSDGLIKVLIMIVSMTLGGLIGELIDIDKQINRLGGFLEQKFDKNGEKGSFAKGFVSCCLLFCVGAMTVNGAFADAMGKPDILIAKAVIDGVACFVMASTLGIGCVFSAFFVLIYQGLLTLVGLFVVEILPAASISYMSMTGSLIIILIGTNVLGITNVKTANLTPAIFIPAFLAPILSLIFG